MAKYKYLNQLQYSASVDFDKTFTPGTPTPFSGIYRCTGCGLSVTSVHNHPLPSQNHIHQHPNALIAIRWQLIVASHWA